MLNPFPTPLGPTHTCQEDHFRALEELLTVSDNSFYGVLGDLA